MNELTTTQKLPLAKQLLMTSTESKERMTKEIISNIIASTNNAATEGKRSIQLNIPCIIFDDVSSWLKAEEFKYETPRYDGDFVDVEIRW